MTQTPEWQVYGYALSSRPELVRAELQEAGIKGEFRFYGPLKDGFYRIEIRVHR